MHRIEYVVEAKNEIVGQEGDERHFSIGLQGS